MLATVSVLAPAKVAAGQVASVSVTITPAAGETISRDGPVIVDVRVDKDSGVSLAQRRYWREDAADPQAGAPRFDVRVRGERPGTWPVTVRVRLWVCAGDICTPVDENRRVDVTVTAAPAPSSQ